jgi:hypothetical protein
MWAMLVHFSTARGLERALIITNNWHLESDEHAADRLPKRIHPSFSHRCVAKESKVRINPVKKGSNWQLYDDKKLPSPDAWW